MIVIYNRNDSMITTNNCNDSGQYYITMKLDSLALAGRVNYDLKLMIVVYDCKTFTVQATVFID